jgi:hypothetical protein
MREGFFRFNGIIFVLEKVEKINNRKIMDLIVKETKFQKLFYTENGFKNNLLKE